MKIRNENLGNFHTPNNKVLITWIRPPGSRSLYIDLQDIKIAKFRGF